MSELPFSTKVQSGVINFSKWEHGTNHRLTRKDRIKFWFQRRKLYQKYVWKRYGTKIIITDLIDLKVKK